MLQKIRDHSQGWITSVIVIMLCLAFGIWGVESYLSSSAQPDVPAKVNGRIISQTELNSTYERLRQQQQIQLGANFVFDQKVEIQLKKQALDQLIMGQILLQTAVKDGYRVAMEQVDRTLLTIPAFQINGRFSSERFKEVLGNILYTEQAFLSDLQTNMLIDQVRLGFLTSAFTLPDEIDTAIKLVNQKRDIAYLIVPASRFIDLAKISDKEALVYYQQHQAEFTTPEQVSIEYVALSLPQLAAQLHFTDVELRQYYQSNISNYTRPVRWHVAHILVKVPKDAAPQQLAAAKAKADKIAARLNAGESFAKLAKEFSDDIASAKNGGVMEWFSPGSIDPTLEKVVIALKQTGDLSAPAKTKYGFSIVKLLDTQKPEVLPFEKVRAQIEKALGQQKAEQAFANDSDKLSNLTYANPTSLDTAAEELGLPIKTTGLFDRNGSKEEVVSNSKVVAAAFSTDVLQGNNSNVIELNPDTLIVLRIKQHKPANLKPFAEVRKTVMEKLGAQLAEQKAQGLGEELLKDLRQQGGSAQQFASQHNLSIKVVNGVDRFGKQAPAAILGATFHTPRPLAGKASSSGLRLPNGDYAVISVLAVHDGDYDKATNAQQRIFGEELENGFGRLDYALYVDALVKKSKVAVNLPK